MPFKYGLEIFTKMEREREKERGVKCEVLQGLEWYGRAPETPLRSQISWREGSEFRNVFNKRLLASETDF